MTDYSTSEAAQRAGVDEGFVLRVGGLGMLPPRPNDRLTQADVRRVQLSHMLDAAGIPLDGRGAHPTRRGVDGLPGDCWRLTEAPLPPQSEKRNRAGTLATWRVGPAAP